ncbi:MAG TPA: proton-conducting transporter membrane subunit [Sedimentisphaerales bacterium]|nr:proton-conducting transporter membrane subunit [Sedimentisphaerales bacterium]
MYNLVTITVFLPLVAGFILLFLPGRIKFVPKVFTLTISALTLALAVWIFGVGPSRYPTASLQIYGFELELILDVTPLRAFILLFAMGFGLLITLYSLKSEAGVKRANMYYGAILLTIGGSAGVLLSDHLLFLLIFWEIVTASLYLLITTGGKNSSFAATKSFAMIGASDAAFLLGIGMVWALSGTFVISQVRLATTSALPIIAFLLLMTAAITKAGALPLHTWLPTSGEYAPPSVMALLPAAIDKLLGIYLLVIIVRQMFIIKSAALSMVLAIIGAATIIIAVMIAMVQHNLKKLLSYHAISQVGYMVLGIATLTPVGIAGGVFHMLNHAIYKCCLFLCGGAAEQAAGTPELDRLGGLGKKMPFTFVTCLIAALSISGVPPLNGFVSKWMVYQGVVQMGTDQVGGAAKLWPIWLVAAMFGSALTLASFVKLIHSIFLSRLPEELKNVKEVSPLQTGPMIVLASLCVFFGVFYHVPLKLFIYPALNIEPASAIFGTWDSLLATALIIIGIVLGLLILLVGFLARKVRTVPTWTCGEVQDNEQMIVPGTHFYKTVSSMGGLKQLYSGQEKSYFDLYNQSSRLGLALTDFLRWLHCGILPMYLTWVTLGLLIVLFVVCKIW